MLTDEEREIQIGRILDRACARPAGIWDAVWQLGRLFPRELWTLAPCLFVLWAVMGGLASLAGSVVSVAPQRLFPMSVPLMFLGMTGAYLLRHGTGGQWELMMTCKYTLLHLSAVHMLLFGALALLCAGVVLLVLPMDEGLELFALGGCLLAAFSALTLALMRRLGLARGFALAPLCWALTCAALLLLPPALGVPPAWLSGLMGLMLSGAFLYELRLLARNQRNGGKEICC